MLIRRTHDTSDSFGHVDHFSHGVLYGWAWSPANPSQRLNVDVFIDQCFIGQFAASSLRSDLKSAGIGDGRYGFMAHISDDCVANATLDRFTVFTTFPSRVRLMHPGEHRSIRQNIQRHKLRRFEPLRKMFRDLVEWQCLTGQLHNEIGPGSSEPQHRLIEKLVGHSPAETRVPWHGHRLSAYADHIRYKYEMQGIYDPSLASSEFDGFLKWYIENYGTARGRKLAPLSAQDINYLNTPVEITSTKQAISRVALLFARDHFFAFPRNGHLTEAEYDSLVYWWVVEESQKLFVADCLVTAEQQLHLQRVPIDVGDVDYPLSTFMTIFVSKNVILNSLRIDRVKDRKLIYFFLLLYALRLPHILKLMPEIWLDRVLDRGSANSLIGEFVGGMFGANYSSVIEGCVRKLAFEQRENGTASQGHKAHRVLATRLSKPHRPKVDVQIIGPFQRILGLGQSCRNLAALIDGLGFRTNLFDLDIENMSPTGRFGNTELDKLSPARINILHLNAEAIPSAIAYLPDIFTDAYNIGFCYWELSTPAKCQLLGLSLTDEIWVASSYIADSFRPFCEVVVNIGMAYEPTSLARPRTTRSMLSKYDIAETDFVFLHVSDALSWVQRKNPLGAIQAFIGAFPEARHLKLIVKTHNIGRVTSPEQQKIWLAVGEIASADPRIILIDETLPHEQHRELIAAADCLVSLHRAEGFGLDLLDALRLGTSVMATNYSGNLDFCDASSTWLVPYDEIFLKHTDYAFAKPGDKWAEPRLDAAINMMQEIYFNESKRHQMAENGRRHIEQYFSAKVISRRMSERLKAILSRPNSEKTE